MERQTVDHYERWIESCQNIMQLDNLKSNINLKIKDHRDVERLNGLIDIKLDELGKDIIEENENPYMSPLESIHY